MKLRQLILAGLAGLWVLTGDAVAQKRPDLSDFPFWPGKSGVLGAQYVPGLTAALLLTEEQLNKLHAARMETVQSAAVGEAGRRLKGEPNLPEPEKAALRKVAEDAREELKVRVNSILMIEQKEFIAKAAELRETAAAAVREQFQEKLGAAKSKGDSARVQVELQEAVGAEFGRRLEKLMTPEQKEAMQKRAELELARRRQAEAAPKKGAK